MFSNPLNTQKQVEFDCPSERSPGQDCCCQFTDNNTTSPRETQLQPEKTERVKNASACSDRVTHGNEKAM